MALCGILILQIIPSSLHTHVDYICYGEIINSKFNPPYHIYSQPLKHGTIFTAQTRKFTKALDRTSSLSFDSSFAKVCDMELA
jgi:hypothetical protein